MNHRRKKLFAVSLSIVMMLTAFPLAVMATSSSGVSYIDENGANQTHGGGITLVGGTPDNDLGAGWYLLQGPAGTWGSRPTITGDVHIILADGADWEFPSGIHVAMGGG